jgi:hypothetical protein
MQRTCLPARPGWPGRQFHDLLAGHQEARIELHGGGGNGHVHHGWSRWTRGTAKGMAEGDRAGHRQAGAAALAEAGRVAHEIVFHADVVDAGECVVAGCPSAATCSGATRRLAANMVMGNMPTLGM